MDTAKTLAIKMGRSRAMGGPVTDQQCIAILILWRHGHFDTFDIAGLPGLGEDQVSRTLHAARGTMRVGL
jgi:hypothetical protein